MLTRRKKVRPSGRTDSSLSPEKEMPLGISDVFQQNTSKNINFKIMILNIVIITNYTNFNLNFTGLK